MMLDVLISRNNKYKMENNLSMYSPERYDIFSDNFYFMNALEEPLLSPSENRLNAENDSYRLTKHLVSGDNPDMLNRLGIDRRQLRRTPRVASLRFSFLNKDLGL